MVIEIKGKNYTPSESLRNVTSRKCVKLARHLHDDAAIARFMVTLENGMYTTDMTVLARGDIYRATTTSQSPFDNLDDVIPKLLEQIRREKQRNSKWHTLEVEVETDEEDVASDDDETSGDADK